MSNLPEVNRFEITGKITHRYEQRNPAPTFRVREFIVRITDQHPTKKSIEEQFARMQLVNKACDWLDDFRAGHYVRVVFRLSGRVKEYNGEPACFTNLEVLELQYESGESEEAADVEEKKPVKDKIYMDDFNIPEEQLADMEKAKAAAEEKADDIFSSKPGDSVDTATEQQFDDLPF